MKYKKLNLKTPVEDLYMVGEAYAQRLKRLGINNVWDFLYHFPFRYNDYSLVSPIASLQRGETVTLKGTIVTCQNSYTKSGKRIQKAVLKDSSGQIEAIWFNQPFIVNILRPGVEIFLAGKVDYFGSRLTFVSPEYELLKAKGSPLHAGRLVPVYRETAKLSSKWLRSRISPLIKLSIPDFLPEGVRKKENLIDLSRALKQIHFPQNREEILSARKRLSFDELFLVQLNVAQRKKKWQHNQLTYPLKGYYKEIKGFISALPFKLTTAQNRVVKEILSDLRKEKPMNRLLEGDVGSGKTVVAAIGVYLCFLNGWQAILMAPTEILAQQHLKTLKSLFKDKVFRGRKLRIGFQSGRKKKIPRGDQFDLLIGTHALIYESKVLKKLSLAIIDEQHRFGVEQRTKLIKRGLTPHILTMTATPIPRTIALTLYGDLKLSVIDEMPPQRKKVKTWVVPVEKRMDAYIWIEKLLKKEKAQAFIVCPLIDESESEVLKLVKSVKIEFKRLSKDVFPDLKLGLLHGQLKGNKKDQIIKKFSQGKLDILVSTPVVEVGIDIPRAILMVIEASDRFGLAQLHQLRGRVGRSKKQSYCLLFASQKDKESLKRLNAMQKYNSGFKLAEIDLKIRGPGEVYGLKQHGFGQLKIASLMDIDTIKKAKVWAEKLINRISKYPTLQRELKNYKIKFVESN
ncbi:ATP-dependent DNA helicase RecG [Candidatus Beckwithbacteria bacterium CG10_big_fil_rev_8_21_14_0_10_34_10]|uniref:Probable DNA 3'-5' helicase RecG n=1 Tax=Candidatus Beckwithbacteria bacterium CG10_big_fil_rev_8_21_14_0_10_34_10 TaxID=1974495 RepID=A0A2H0WAH0_9BACT|nr:MAG: ATP-dependent DNA helicase RecG [Candidatus Beckwithbacteria bacterium CG10_big_fil_rev_8_21_14_0_10_34_10]